MDWVIDFFNLILSGFQYVLDFIGEGIHEVFRQFGEFLYSFAQMLFYDFLYYATLVVQYCFEATITQVDFASEVVSSWLSIPSEVRNALVFFKVTDCVVIVGTAMSLKFILRFVPFF